MTDDYQNIATIYNRLFSNSLKQLREDIRTYIFHKKFERIVDICCGTGEQLYLLEKPGVHLTGIDNSLAMLEQARSYCNKHTELHFLDAEQDSFSKESFDCAIITLALHEKHPTAAQAIFDNCRNLICEKGVIIVADYTHPLPSFLGTLIGKMIIPIVERCAGSEHYNNYVHWMQHGGLEGFLSKQHDTCDIISQPLRTSLLCCAVTKIEAGLKYRENFGLLDHTLSLNSKRPGKISHDSRK